MLCEDIQHISRLHSLTPNTTISKRIITILQTLLQQSITSEQTPSPETILNTWQSYSTFYSSSFSFSSSSSSQLNKITYERNNDTNYICRMEFLSTIDPHRDALLYVSRFLSILINTFILNSKHQITRQKEQDSTASFNMSLKHTDAPSVVIVGGGPAGLSSGLTSVVEGGSVVIVEKRSQYTRDIWFDVSMMDAWAPTGSMLREWGWTFQDPEHVTYRHTLDEAGEESALFITIQCAALENYLQHVIHIIGGVLPIRMVHGNGKEIDPEHAIIHVTVDNQNSTVAFPYNILIGADGSRSGVRSNLNVNWQRKEEFLTTPRSQVTIPNLSQIAILLELHSNSSGTSNCPEPARDPLNGDVIDPWTPGILIDGVLCVFKRFFYGSCHVQVLLTKDRGQLVWDAYQRDKIIPWRLLTEVGQQIFAHPPNSIKDMKSLVDQVSVLEIPIQFIKTPVLSFNSTSSIASHSNNYGQYAVITGDAAVTAHFRLGIGVNTAFNNSRDIGMFVRQLHQSSSKEDRIQAFHEFDSIITERISRMAENEARIVFLESYCDGLAFFDANELHGWESAQGYWKNRKKGKFMRVDLRMLIDQCVQYLIRRGDIPKQ